MIEETAIVVRTSGEHAWVEAQRQSACDACAANKGCGSSMLSRLFGRKVARMKTLNAAQAREGDAVIVAMNEAAFLKGSILVSLDPLQAKLGAAVLGQGLAAQLDIASAEALAIVFGVGGFAIAGILVRRHLQRMTRETRFQPVVVRRVEATGGLPLRHAGMQH
ncbi:MAG: SoxR reducing system RseC family protein [Pseudomonadota bacterium]|nr:MAG: SoxR reducing system RseC family protein [Pseudomonadota bacterium]